MVQCETFCNNFCSLKNPRFVGILSVYSLSCCYCSFVFPILQIICSYILYDLFIKEYDFKDDETLINTDCDNQYVQFEQLFEEYINDDNDATRYVSVIELIERMESFGYTGWISVIAIVIYFLTHIVCDRIQRKYDGEFKRDYIEGILGLIAGAACLALFIAAIANADAARKFTTLMWKVDAYCNKSSDIATILDGINDWYDTPRIVFLIVAYIVEGVTTCVIVGFIAIECYLKRKEAKEIKSRQELQRKQMKRSAKQRNRSFDSLPKQDSNSAGVIIPTQDSD